LYICIKDTYCKTITLQPLRLIVFEIAEITTLQKLQVYKPKQYNSPEYILKYQNTVNV